MSETNARLIHVAHVLNEEGKRGYLLLRQLKENHFTWFKEIKHGDEVETSVSAQTIEEALRLAVRQWKNNSFSYVICGFRYTLPDRDEHGINALFHQMADSYSSMNGVYYDKELGCNCFVQNASKEALNLRQRMNKQPL